jgi:hypothetical protein
VGRGARYEELDGPAVSALRSAIAEVKQRWSVIEWVTNYLLSRVPPCFGRHVKPLVPAVFASSHQSGLPVLLMCVIHKEGLCLSSGAINRLMMMIRYRHPRDAYSLLPVVLSAICIISWRSCVCKDTLLNNYFIINYH